MNFDQLRVGVLKTQNFFALPFRVTLQVHVGVQILWFPSLIRITWIFSDLGQILVFVEIPVPTELIAV